jgi:hypothetical protein
MKISACGQELGSEMLFPRRIGFSGTPSELLPLELGKCHYEVGSDGKMISFLTSPEIVAATIVKEGWTPETILDEIATADPPYHALIDAGALITGLSNYQVALYLLQKGLKDIDGVVFLDEQDRKVILVRDGLRVWPLAQCDINKTRRFAFYDQVHTTGMDIQHTLNARAVLTLGKDMTFRDYAQGAFRMRGIGKGQTIQLLLTPEVRQLIHQSTGYTVVADTNNTTALRTSQAAVVSVTKETLSQVTAWLTTNSMRSESIQFNMLCEQSVYNIFRKNSFLTLLTGYKVRRSTFLRG